MRPTRRLKPTKRARRGVMGDESKVFWFRVREKATSAKPSIDILYGSSINYGRIICFTSTPYTSGADTSNSVVPLMPWWHLASCLVE
jgi:hypothetical protein